MLEVLGKVGGWLFGAERAETVENGEAPLGSLNGGWVSRAETVDSDVPMVRLRARSGLSLGFWPFSDCEK